MRKIGMLALLGAMILPAVGCEAQPYYGYGYDRSYGRPNPYWERERAEARERRHEYWEHRREREYEEARRQQDYARQQQGQRW